VTLLGKRIKVKTIPLENVAESMDQVAALYLCPGLSIAELERVLASTHKHHVLTVTGYEKYIHRGVSLGVIVRKGKPRIVVNSAAVRAEGAKFSSKLLRIAEVIN
jgi:hypothetical protein